MNPGFGHHSHLAPGPNYHRRPSSDRRSSSSHADGVATMERELSNSSFFTDSSQTSNYIHSNIGDSISPTSHTVPSYSREYSGAFNWGLDGQVAAEDDNTFDHNLFPSITAPQLTVSTYDENLNIDSGVNDPDVLLERFISRLRQDYNGQQDRLAYVLELFRRYLQVDSIPTPSPSGEQLPRTPQVRVQPATNDHRPQHKGQYVCLLCDSPIPLRTRGTFKRHVSEMHRAKSEFHCMHCDWSHRRKDKFQSHLRLRHYEDGHHTPQEIRAQEYLLPVPLACDLCASYEPPIHNPPFDSWDSWFDCIEIHCHLEVNDEDQSESDSHPPDRNDDNAGGAAGGYSPYSPFPQGPNAGGASFGQMNVWAYGTGSSQWQTNTHTTPGYQAFCDSPEAQVCELDKDPSPGDRGSELFRSSHTKDASMSSPKQLVTKPKPGTPSQMDLSVMNDPAISILSDQMSMLFLDSKPKAVASLNDAQRPLSTKQDSEIANRMILEKSSMIPNVIQGLALASLVYLVNEISLHTYGKPYNNGMFHDYAKVVADPLEAGEKTLHHIQYDHPISREIVSRQLTRCHASLDAIQSELSTSSLSSHASAKQMCRRRRLSSLFARLRAVTFILLLQKEVVGKETPNLPIAGSQLDLVKPDSVATPPPAYQRYSSDPCETVTKSGGPTLCMPTLESSLGACDVSNFLHALTSKISMPKASFVESYEDLYGLLHHLVPNIPGTSF